MQIQIGSDIKQKLAEIGKSKFADAALPEDVDYKIDQSLASDISKLLSFKDVARTDADPYLAEIESLTPEYPTIKFYMAEVPSTPSPISGRYQSTGLKFWLLGSGECIVLWTASANYEEIGRYSSNAGASVLIVCGGIIPGKSREADKGKLPYWLNIKKPFRIYYIDEIE